MASKPSADELTLKCAACYRSRQPGKLTGLGAVVRWPGLQSQLPATGKAHEFHSQPGQPQAEKIWRSGVRSHDDKTEAHISTGKRITIIVLLGHAF